MDPQDVYRFEAEHVFPDKSQTLEEGLVSGDGYLEATVNLGE